MGLHCSTSENYNVFQPSQILLWRHILGGICYRKICLTLCKLAQKAFFHFPMHTRSPLLQIPELKTIFCHIYTPYLLYNMCIHRLHHYNLRTSGNILRIEKWCWVSMSRQEINHHWPPIYWKNYESALQFHLKAINGPNLSYGKEEKQFNFERKVTLEELFTSHWVCIPLSFMFGHIVHPPSSSLTD